MEAEIPLNSSRRELIGKLCFINNVSQNGSYIYIYESLINGRASHE